MHKALRQQVLTAIKEEETLPNIEVDMHQDILLNLFNPQTDINLTEFTYNPNSSLNNTSTIKLSSNSKLDFSSLGQENICRLPTLSEYKMFLWIWKYASMHGCYQFIITNINEFLREIGYTPTHANHVLLCNTLQIYQRLNIQYIHSFTTQIKQKQDKSEKNKCRTKVEFLTLVPLMGGSIKRDKNKELKSISFLFTPQFIDFSKKDSNGLLRHLNIAHIQALKSPLTVKLYLYFLKWSRKDGEYTRSCNFELQRFRSILGLTSIESSSEHRDFLRVLKQSLEIIKQVNPDFEFYINEVMFKNSSHRLIKFETNMDKIKILQRKQLPSKIIKRISDFGSTQLNWFSDPYADS